jgi:nucleoside recognition membrane protein YjiH
MRAWWALAAGLALIVFGYLGDRVVGAAFEEARRTFSSQWAIALDGVTRLVAVALMVGLGWLVFSGPRQRVVGSLMVVVGGYFALVPAFSFALLANTGISLPPFALEAYQYPANLLLWTSAAVAVLGLVELFWPTPSHSTEESGRAGARPDGAEVASRP